jgi:hypothetical protein
MGRGREQGTEFLYLLTSIKDSLMEFKGGLMSIKDSLMEFKISPLPLRSPAS